MKTIFTALIIASLGSSLFALTPEEGKTFTDKYKAAYEAGDRATLQSFLYTKDANPAALEFYKAMQADGAGQAKISKIELLDLTPEDVKRASEVQSGPDGTKAQFSVKPAKKLKIAIESKNSSGSSANTMTIYIAELDGKYVIPVPATAK